MIRIPSQNCSAAITLECLRNVNNLLESLPRITPRSTAVLDYDSRAQRYIQTIEAVAHIRTDEHTFPPAY